jgi:hypothetical protein
VVLDFFRHADAHGGPPLLSMRSWSQQRRRNSLPMKRSKTRDARNILRRSAEFAHES